LNLKLYRFLEKDTLVNFLQAV